MSVSLTVSNDSVDEMIADLKRIFPSLLAGTSPPLQPVSGEVIDPPAKPARKSRKDKEPETIEGKVEAPLSGASNVEKTESASTSSTTARSEASASTASSVPDLDTVRAKLKELGATDGLGHDKVFEVLGKYGAKNASTVPEDKRAAVIAEIDALIAGVSA